MIDLADLRRELVAANRILDHEGILDAYGHVSVRDRDHPGHFLLCRARSPANVEVSDVLEFDAEGGLVGGDGAIPYVERFIHAAVYAARPDVGAVCHNHALSILPFSVSTTPLRSVIHSARFIGPGAPVWDIAREFPGEWSPLVRNYTYGASLAAALGDGAIALLRGHGCVVVGRTPHEVVDRCISMGKNAQVQETAHRLGEYTPLHPGECEDILNPGPPLAADNRAWEYFLHRAGLDRD